MFGVKNRRESVKSRRHCCVEGEGHSPDGSDRSDSYGRHDIPAHLVSIDGPEPAVRDWPRGRSRPTQRCRLEPSVVAFDTIVRALLGVVKRVRQHLFDGLLERRCQIGHDLVGFAVRGECRCEELAGCCNVAAPRHEDVNDLAITLNSPIHIAPPPSDLHIRLVYQPSAAEGVTARTRRSDQQRREPLHPRYNVTWSTSMPRSARSSSRSRYDSPYPRYQRTANMITSGGNRNPANPDTSWTVGWRRRCLITARSPPEHYPSTQQCLHDGGDRSYRSPSPKVRGVLDRQQYQLGSDSESNALSWTVGASPASASLRKAPPTSGVIVAGKWPYGVS